jgi:NTP pyrophosphatase (non-canonical NTP hydrolase)
MTKIEINNFETITRKVKKWAEEKNINNPDLQILKVYEEYGELCKGVLENDLELIKDSIGDLIVTLIIHSNQTGVKYRGWNKFPERHENKTKLLSKINSSIAKGSNKTFAYIQELARLYNTTNSECLKIAWNEIKNRTGKTVNGTFIKDK